MELIKIGSTTIGTESKQTVNARELHAFLEVGKDFSTWIKDRIGQYEFTENQDFVVFTDSGEKPSGGRPSKDYHLSLDMAKELSMVERNEKGKQARQYFIECERRAKQPAIPQDPIILMRIEQLAMQGQVATLEAKAGALEDQTARLARHSEHLEDWSETQAEKTHILEHETANLGNQANQMKETLAKLRGGLDYTYGLVKELRERPAPTATVCLRPPTNPVTQRLHKKGYTVRSWAKEHGFDYWAVRNVISGISQKAAVKETLKQEGMLEADLF